MKWSNLIFLPVWVVGFLVLVSAASLFWVFSCGFETSPIAWFVYAFSAYSLTVLSFSCWKTLPKLYAGIRSAVYANKYSRRYVSDVVFKTEINLIFSFVLDLLYAGVNLLLAVYYNTHWFAIFAGYYAVLSFMRILLTCSLLSPSENRVRELKNVRFCAYVLLTVNLVLSALILMMMYHPWEFGKLGVLIYAAALYSFASLTLSLVGLIRFRKYRRSILSISKMINLTAALVSLLILEMAMLSQFGVGMSLYAQKIMLVMTGAGICVAIVCMSLYQIVSTTREIKKAV